eukprot:scaffold202908_cov17-Tisochrysis_lutea.AAC.2
MKSPCLGGGRRPLCNALGVSVEGQQGRAARRKLAPGHLLHMVRAAGRAARCKLAPGHLCMLMCGDVTPWFHYRGRYMHEAWAAGKGSAPQKLAPGHLCMLNGRRRVSPQGSERGRGRAVRHEGDVSTRHRGAQGVGIGRELWAACHMRDACTGRRQVGVKGIDFKGSACCMLALRAPVHLPHIQHHMRPRRSSVTTSWCETRKGTTWHRDLRDLRN